MNDGSTCGCGHDSCDTKPSQQNQPSQEGDTCSVNAGDSCESCS